MDLNLRGKIALVTGSNRGTGQIIASRLAIEGATVIAHGLERGSADHLLAASGIAHATWGDIRSDDGAAALAEQINQIVDSVDILVNNYGMADSQTWDSAQSKDWIESYQVNVLSAARMIRFATPAMRKKRWGRVIQLGTIGSVRPNALRPHYYAAKGALANMTVSLAKELAGSGITVNTVSPGLIRTPEIEAGYREKAERKGWGNDWQTIEARIVEERFPNPSGRIATREEVADLVCFLASEKAGFINGQNIRIDGGAVDLVL